MHERGLKQSIRPSFLPFFAHLHHRSATCETTFFLVGLRGPSDGDELAKEIPITLTVAGMKRIVAVKGERMNGRRTVNLRCDVARGKGEALKTRHCHSVDARIWT